MGMPRPDPSDRCPKKSPKPLHPPQHRQPWKSLPRRRCLSPGRRRRARWYALLALLVVAAAVGFILMSGDLRSRLFGGGSGAVTAPPGSGAGYVGRSACGECHAREQAAWHGSDHDLAMQVADDKTVLGDFANAKFKYAGTTSTFSRRDGKYFVNTDGPDGKLHDYEIKYTFGVHPLQQYLVELPGGRMQALSIAWDSRPKEQGGQRWFHLYPGQNIKAGDWLHWTSGGQNWNFTCAECHSTNLRKNFDAATGIYHTTWSELNVSCEACHGPGSNHVTWAKKGADWHAFDADKGLAIALDERRGVTWTPVARPATPSAACRGKARARSRCARAAMAERAGCPTTTSTASRRSTRIGWHARRRPVLERRPDARRGLQLGLVRAKPDVRDGRDVFRLPRPAFAQAARARQLGMCAVPPAGEVRRGNPHASRARHAGRRVRGLPHADDDVHAGRPAARSFAAHSASGPVRHARHAQRVQQLPHEAIGAVGGRGHTKVDRQAACRLPAFRRSAACGFGRRGPAPAVRCLRSSTTRRSRRSRAPAPSRALAIC